MTRLRRGEVAMYLGTAFAFAIMAAASAVPPSSWFAAAVYGVVAAGWTRLWVLAVRSHEARLRYVVLSWLAEHPGERIYSVDLARDLGLGTGCAPLLPVLWQLELEGIVQSGWDPLEPGQRFRRRWYQASGAVP